MAAGGSRHLRVGLVLEQPLVGRNKDPFQYPAYRGLVRAAKHLHVQAKALAPTPTAADPYAAQFSYLARRHYDLVIAVGFLQTHAVSRAARRSPHMKFGLVDATRHDVPHHPPNLEGTVFHMEQAAYLAGFVAARMADRRGRPHVVSTVGGVKIPPVDAYIAGFRAGARHADPKIKLLNTYTDDFLNPAKCANAARLQIARGSQVVFSVAGACGLGALEAAKRRGVYGIGVDIDESNLGDFILTSVVKNLNVAVYEFVERLVEGRLKTGGNLSFDLLDKGVRLGAFSPDVPPALRRALRPLATKIERGKIVVPATLSPSR